MSWDSLKALMMSSVTAISSGLPALWAQRTSSPSEEALEAVQAARAGPARAAPPEAAANWRRWRRCMVITPM